MKHIRRHCLLPIGISLVLILFAGTAAAFGSMSDSRHWVQADNRGHSLGQTVNRFKHGDQGRVLSADTVHKRGRTYHEIKVLTDKGRVRRYRVDPVTGEYLRHGH